ncbi:FTR1 family iron permease [Advenella mimigardefordensis]|uniref:Putative ferrous iron permease, FTR1 family n=1 Tax=Advenella mimigardefordensis (strain DSM 17166 / LMG 22922 / DPN7) TaxID=1247726 RepID=W0P7N9_ADVMD|nr:FTR1 family protein [Advenella mimigardefordensis]AHG62721.1 putative ferrous iron permease, FTR1 family [Advenella mimigardefordensis DPN7]
MDQVAFIVWRESVEALLVVGILYTWLRASPDGRRGLPWLWGGVAAGLVLAIALALVFMGVSTWLSDTGQEWFQAIMALVACGLVVQMVLWMKKHGARLKSELVSGAAVNVQRNSWWGLLILVMIAVAREGSETVVFLWGTVLAGAQQDQALALAAAGVGGFLLALLTFYVLQLGGKVITWRRFFQITEILLLLLAASLLMNGIDHLISLEAIPTLVDPVWDTSAVLDDSSGLGKVLADFAGYRAMPSLTHVIVFILYWLAIGLLYRWLRPAVAPKMVSSHG